MSAGFKVSRVATAVLAVGLTLAWGGVSRAAFIAADSGNTNISSNPPVVGGVDGTINFGVELNTGAGFSPTSGTFVAGTGSGALDTTAKYLYLYQVTNNGSISASISSASIGINTGSATSYGYFTGSTLSDNAGEVRGTPLPVGNDFGTDGAVFVNGAPANLGVVTPGMVAATGTGVQVPKVPTSVSINGTGSSLVVSWTAASGTSSPIANGGRSVVFGFTSNLSPAILIGSIVDHGSTGNGHVISTSPEPGSFLAAAIACPCLFGFWGWKRRRA
jgi:hypothetical protein